MHRGEIWTHDVGHTLINFEQRYTNPEHRLLPGRLSMQELRLLAADHDGWNAAFSRPRGIPAIRERVHRYLTAPHPTGLKSTIRFG